MRFSLIIPCYNENENLPFLFKKLENILQKNLFEIIIVENGSNDGSLDTIKSYQLKYKNLKFLKIHKNEGYGNGILRGLDMATGDFLSWTHADMQTDPQDILKGEILIKKNKKNRNLFIKGIRSGRSINDRFFTIGMSFFCSLALGKFLWDINAQPSIFSAAFFKSWKNPPKDFSLDLYAYYMAKKSGYKVVRIPVRFNKRLYGSSKWNIDLFSKFKFIKRTIKFTLALSR